jgi:hypothetical protein
LKNASTAIKLWIPHCNLAERILPSNGKNRGITARTVSSAVAFNLLQHIECCSVFSQFRYSRGAVDCCQDVMLSQPEIYKIYVHLWLG